ncbi:MAG: Nif3-like dinuclear metal center hexameric protein [Clostridia bacterium]|nr:Nif3-like dinuclear metal center hexameric protein [Clostridia bacterium]
MEAKKIFKIIEKHAPLSLQLDFDSSGFNVGNRDAEINGILVSENVTHEVIKEAIDNQCNLIISHHPAIFGENIDAFTQSIVQYAHDNEITLYSAHTNLDATKDGLNDELAKILGVEVEEGYGTCSRIGHFIDCGTLEKKAKLIGELLNDTHIRTVGDKNRVLKRVCISCGSGGRDDDLVEELKDKDIDVLIGGENKLSLAIKMKYYDICLIEVGHYDSEIMCKDIFARWLQDVGVKVVKSTSDVSPYNK